MFLDRSRCQSSKVKLNDHSGLETNVSGVLMDYNKSQQVLLEVLELIQMTDLEAFSLKNSQKGLYGTGYSVVIKAFLTSVNKLKVYEIAKKHGLHVVERQEGFTLYKPR